METALPPVDPTEPIDPNFYPGFYSDFRTRYYRGRKIEDIYNIRIDGINNRDLAGYLGAIHQEQRTSYKLNISFGLVLMNAEGELRYYHPSNNVGVFYDYPFQISSHKDLLKVQETIGGEHFEDRLSNRIRLNTKWLLLHVTNVTFFIIKMVNFQL